MALSSEADSAFIFGRELAHASGGINRVSKLTAYKIHPHRHPNPAQQNYALTIGLRSLRYLLFTPSPSPTALFALQNPRHQADDRGPWRLAFK